MAQAHTTGRRLFLDLLRQEGVRVLFGNPGTTELPLMDAFAAEEDIRYVLALQESLVMAMADGYARASNGIAACNVHVAPGLGNAMGMLFDAMKAGSPVLVTAGQQAQGFGITEPNLYAELPPLAQHFTKYAVEARSIRDMPRLLHRAVKTALAPPTGPVFVSFPVDVMNAEGEVEIGVPSRVAPHIVGDPAAIAQAAAMLHKAERPVIIAGDSVAQSGCSAALVALAEALAAPVYLEGEPTTLPFPPSHPLFRGPIVRLGAAIRKITDAHDLLFSAGADLFTLSLPPDVMPVADGYPIVHLDTNPWELAKNYPTAAAILGDPRTTLPEIAKALAGLMTPADCSRRDARLSAVTSAIAADYAALQSRARAESDRTPVSPLSLMQALGDTLPPEAVVVDESISSGAGLFQFLQNTPPGNLFGNRGGGIGWGLPASIGLQLALPDKRVVALIGDGSAMYSIQALWTAAHDRVPVIFVIINNGAYRILKQRLSATQGVAAQRGRYVGMELNDPAINFTGLAASMGVPAVSVNSIPKFIEALHLGLKSEHPLLIDVATDPTFK